MWCVYVADRVTLSIFIVDGRRHSLPCAFTSHLSPSGYVFNMTIKFKNKLRRSTKYISIRYFFKKYSNNPFKIILFPRYHLHILRLAGRKKREEGRKIEMFLEMDDWRWLIINGRKIYRLSIYVCDARCIEIHALSTYKWAIICDGSTQSGNKWLGAK